MEVSPLQHTAAAVVVVAAIVCVRVGKYDLGTDCVHVRSGAWARSILGAAAHIFDYIRILIAVLKPPGAILGRL